MADYSDLRAAAQKATPPTANDLAKRFHELYEYFAPTSGYETRKDSAVPWGDVPHANRALMVAVCSEILHEFFPLALLDELQGLREREGRVRALAKALLDELQGLREREGRVRALAKSWSTVFSSARMTGAVAARDVLRALDGAA